MYTRSNFKKKKPVVIRKADANFYIDRAYKLRAAFFNSLIENMNSWLKSHVKQIYCRIFICGNALSH